jgi:hypothetical protein
MDIIQIILSVIGFIIAAILVPGVLLVIFLQTLRLAASRSGPAARQVRKWLALLLGLSIFALLVTLHIFGKLFVPTKGTDTFESLWVFVLAGFITGMLLLIFIHIYSTNAKEILEPIFIALLSATTLSSLYLYLFIDAYRGAILATTLGMIVGALLYAIFDPIVVEALVVSLKLDSPSQSRR